MRVYLFRWYRHVQIDVRVGSSPWLSVGLRWATTRLPRPVFYLSPDATPASAFFGIKGGM